MLKTLDAFSFEAQPDLDREAVLQVFDYSFVAEAANVVFVGGVGTGKTHLSIALGMACCQHDYRVRFVTVAELVTLLVEAQQQGRLQRKLDQLARYDVVIARWSEVFLEHCRAGQRDRVLTGVKARRCAPPPLRGAAALTPAPRTVTDLLARQTRNISSRKEAGAN